MFKLCVKLILKPQDFQSNGWILFIYSMMVDIGPKFYAIFSQPTYMTSRSMSQNFCLSFCIKVFWTIFFSNLFWSYTVWWKNLVQSFTQYLPHPPTWPHGQGHRLWVVIFKFCVKDFRTTLFPNHWMDWVDLFIYSMMIDSLATRPIYKYVCHFLFTHYYYYYSFIFYFLIQCLASLWVNFSSVVVSEIYYL